MAGLVRARWTDAIHEEWIRNLLRNRPDSLIRQIVDPHRSVRVHLEHRVHEMRGIGEGESRPKREIEETDLVVSRDVRQNDGAGMKPSLLQHGLEIAPVVRDKREVAFDQTRTKVGVLS
jgi:hypothetical protein